ncbi:olfactory receptor class A-like protein 4 isoform X2 [Kryptolebias marmoratus]|uniref:olfactory receptor class A-like protein 4 isoform X2 n=1 Tax=Kryptolebias marmoratus TaxID=37003 RepID=UPI000D52FEB5|nr:olfactory receptor class A-like protein 4 isoform X2 [Kryptolebias marmoratus]
MELAVKTDSKILDLETNETAKQEESATLVGMGLRTSVSPAQSAFYIILVALGIVGNVIVIWVIGKSVIMDRGGGHNSDIIIVNMALSNLMVSVMRNVLLIISDLGFELYSSKGWCKFLMGIWVWLRSVNVWSTLFLSAFHLHTLKRVAPSVGNLQGPWGTHKTLLLSLSLIWLLNFLYAIPAHIFSTNGNENTTETLMLISSTTRPLLGCVWKFPSNYSGLAYATTSMAIHEVFPIVLMVLANVTSLYTLYNHGRMRTSVQDAPVIKRVPAERRAAKVILALVILFILSWGTSIISVNYFNYNQGSSAEFLLVIARFANTIFIAWSPIVLAVGHRGLRTCIKSTLTY